MVDPVVQVVLDHVEALIFGGSSSSPEHGGVVGGDPDGEPRSHGDKRLANQLAADAACEAFLASRGA